jgi:hypothetical protein
MSPREIDVYIEELVLDGFAPGDRWQIGDALENELRGLLAEKGLPAAWRTNPERLNTGAIRLTSPGETGKRIADAVYRGGPIS